MKVGFVGLGKLGLPCAIVASRHHDVVGYDIDPRTKEHLRTRTYPHREQRIEQFMAEHRVTTVEFIDDVVNHSDLVFVAVQTPHHPLYEGTTRVPESRADFDYRFLVESVKVLAASAAENKKPIVVAVISTVLPGTMEREVAPHLNEYTKLVYNPFFIAMGTTILDYLNPEFILLGVDDVDAANVVHRFYGGFVTSPVRAMSIKSAELTKVTYNTFIGLKIALANTVMQICHETGANCDDVTAALCSATDRLISPRYMRGGMGDSGGCHPRDNIAMSWLSEKLGFGYDLFGSIMHVREMQTEWLADMVAKDFRMTERPITILGSAYKPETNLTYGSCSTLLSNILKENGLHDNVSTWDPEVTPGAMRPWAFDRPGIFFLATDHACFKDIELPTGSVLYDPWATSKDRPGVETIRIGRQQAVGPVLP